MDRFDELTSEKLCYYVYRLIDPRNGETFYIGKGKGNRIFQHAKAALQAGEDEDSLDLKFSRINEIMSSELSVIHIVHRHGLSDKEAMEVEAALIDATPGLSNIQRGYASADRGPMHVKQIHSLYSAEPVTFKHGVVLININHSYSSGIGVYDAVRYAWKINRHRASSCEYVLAVYKGIIKGVFIAEEWLEATQENFPGFPRPEDGAPTRYGFQGKEAPKQIKDLYIGKRYIFPGQYPINYKP